MRILMELLAMDGVAKLGASLRTACKNVTRNDRCQKKFYSNTRTFDGEINPVRTAVSASVTFYKNFKNSLDRKGKSVDYPG